MKLTSTSAAMTVSAVNAKWHQQLRWSHSVKNSSFGVTKSDKELRKGKEEYLYSAIYMLSQSVQAYITQFCRPSC